LGNEWPSSEDEDTDSSTRRYRRLRSCPREIKPVLPLQDGDELPSNTLEPHARFFIERKRNVVSLKFDPPVSVFRSLHDDLFADLSSSGRYVLVKLWSPENRDNIDIQNISIYGYAGTRFIPAIQFR
jgi:hypothetical protein